VSDLVSKADENVGACAGHLPFVRDAIVDPSRLRSSIDGVASVSSLTIDAIVGEVPGRFADAVGLNAIRTFLLERQRLLLDLFRRDRGFFPNLGGGVI